MTPPVRVRFAPSPTGYLHVGGLRTALYNYLFARRQGGTFILRIEDTDRSRAVEGAVENLIDTLRWAKLEYDEGPGKGGEFGPYIQSERLAVYGEHAARLLAGGSAYRCFCTPQRLEEMRRNQERLRLQPKYDRRCLGMPKEEAARLAAEAAPSVIRMLVPSSDQIRFRDLIRGEIEVAGEQVDDQVLIKSDGFPTYHLANVVDDHLMNISHVIRGEEWLSSTPKHVILYRAFGWAPPAFAHLPLLLNTDRTKLSKRQGDVAVEEYRSNGYLNDALINFVALLGWNPGTEEELFSLAELARRFSLEQVNMSGAVFNIEKLNWLNGEYLRRMPAAELLGHVREALGSSRFSGRRFDDATLLRVIEAMRPRVSRVRDFIDRCPYFYEAPVSFDGETVKKRWGPGTSALMKSLGEKFSLLGDSRKADFEEALHETARSLGEDNGRLIHAVRLAVSGIGAGPGVYDILEILGKDETVRRIAAAIRAIK